MQICITGTIGSGKSSVAKEIAKRLRAEIFDADTYCRHLMGPGHEGLRLFNLESDGKYLLDEGSLDRKKLREDICGNVEVRKSLEKILHPLVYNKIKRTIDAVLEREVACVYEIPLYHELSWQLRFDRIITVYARPSICLDRVMGRDNVSFDNAAAMLRLQLPAEDKAYLSDSVIDNSDTWLSTLYQIYSLTEYITGGTNHVLQD